MTLVTLLLIFSAFCVLTAMVGSYLIGLTVGQRREHRKFRGQELQWREAMMELGIDPDDPRGIQSLKRNPRIGPSWTGLPVEERAAAPVGTQRSWSDPPRRTE